LAVAIERNHVASAKLLLDRGANVNVQFSGYEQHTLLHTAVLHRNPELVELLLQHGANVNAKNKRGETPIELLSLMCESMVTTNGQTDCQLGAREQQVRALLKRYGATE